MRELTEHRVNPANNEITLTAMGEPGAGGAHHRYHMRIGDALFAAEIVFQNGPIAETGVNGITEEVLLAILADRLRCFQEGPYKCDENAGALAAIVGAQVFLHKRTRGRMVRGVEGTSAV